MSSISLFYRISLRTAFAGFLLFLLSCGGGPSKPQDPSEQTVYIPLEEIPALLESAQQEVNQDKAAIMRLQAVDSLVKLNELDWARNILQSMFANALLDEHYLRFNILSAQLALAEGRPFRAKRYLWEERFQDTLGQADLETQINAADMRASLLNDIAEYRASIRERIALDALLLEKPDERSLNQELLWQTLMELPLQDLSMESQIQSEGILKGWYSLAALSKDNQTNIRLQLASVESWVRQWPAHPASLSLPADLQLLQQLVEQQARKVALLLPLTGRLQAPAKAIREGFMAGWYKANTNSNMGSEIEGGESSAPIVRFYDTEQGDINALYDQAVAEGAEMIIGPLDKARIAELSLRPALEVPTLSLNFTDSELILSEGMYQFGLAPEDDARQVARRAWRDGHRRAMILAPNSTWGDRSVNAFSQVWLEQGGELTKDYRYSQPKNYSKLIAEAMDISDSNKRRRRIRSVLGQVDLEFEPRKRGDVDMIFLIAHPGNARQLKPSLAFHYAGSVPVYATSHVYNGEVNPSDDKDMNTIRFVSLPWFFDSRMAEKRDIERYANRATSYQRFYAFGLDSFHLFPRLQQLGSVKQAHFYGATGRLSVDENRRIVREQTWAQFIQGRAVSMPTVSQEQNEG